MSKLDEAKSKLGDVKEVKGVSGHPDRYVDDDEEFRARVWFTFDEIAGGNETISYIKFIRWVACEWSFFSQHNWICAFAKLCVVLL